LIETLAKEVVGSDGATRGFELLIKDRPARTTWGSFTEDNNMTETTKKAKCHTNRSYLQLPHPSTRFFFCGGRSDAVRFGAKKAWVNRVRARADWAL
jgi:hypothetical protein